MSFDDYILQRTRLVYLAIPRMIVGYHFISVALPKLARGFTNGNDLPAQLMRGIAKDPIGLHREFIEGFVMAHNGFFSYLVPYGELAIGISLLVGCLVRVSSAFGAFHNLNILLAVAIPGGGAQIAINTIFIALQITFIMSSAGRSLGLDAVLKKLFPRSSLF